MASEGMGAGEKPIRMPKKAMKVKNKAPAPVQITAEQLLREAKERDLEILPPPPKQKISDPEELKEYQLKRRKEYEDSLRKNNRSVPNWIKYAKWEESQGEVQRARSIFERALDIDHRNIGVWLQYAAMEIRNRQINHARNIWDRAVSILPRASQFWLKYTYMEEMLGNIPGARQVFERWMEWEPSEQAWQTYINFELRYKEIERAREIWQRFLHIHGESANWIRYAKFEERHGFIENARQVFERAVEYFGNEHVEEKLLLAFSKFEEGHKEHDRARTIYKFALDNLSKEKSQEIYKAYSVHEKKYGERVGIESVIVSKRRHQYEEAVAENSYNYDVWFDYLRLMESERAEDVEAVRDIYERAIANVPLEQEKRLWRRYIYLWINYALYEELHAKDADRTRQVYKACIQLIPHKKFTFAKIWLLYAQFEIRQKDLQAARKILGHAIGACPKDKLFRGYIDLELQLREFDRCRILYEKFLEYSPENCTTWIKFAELETLLGDDERARAIYELAIGQPTLDMPEVLWKAYIDFEVGQEEYDKARRLYYRLLQRTQHVKVWLSLTQFEQTYGDGEASEKAENARKAFRKANSALRSSMAEKEERMVLLEAWKQFEAENGTEVSMREVEKEMPKCVKKRRQIKAADGTEAGWEEYFDYIFPADEPAQSNLKLLAMAKKWKMRAEDTNEDETDQSSSQILDEIKEETSSTVEEKIREGDSDTDIESDDQENENEGSKDD